MAYFKNKTIFLGILAALAVLSCANSNTETDKLVITEYSDYQCPACAYYQPFVEKIKQDMGDRVQFNLRYFPLQSHQYAALAARAAQAAKNQGKFKEMHNLLFKRQDRWAGSPNPATTIVNFAREIGLDLNQFTEDLNAEETQEIVMDQRNEGLQKGVNATPTFFIEGEKVDPLPKTYEEFEALIKKHLEKKQG